jgi:hypothetical protein
LLLTQTSHPVKEKVQEYTKNLAGVVTGKTDVVGFALVLDGVVKNADLYGSPELFFAAWPKLLKSSVVEALQRGSSGRTAAVDGSTVAEFLREAYTIRETKTAINSRTQLVLRDGAGQDLTESRDGAAWVHRRVVGK